MRVRVDRIADAVYLNLTDATIAESEAAADGIVVDYDAQGRIVGVEVLDASRRTGDPDLLKAMGFDLPSAAYRSLASRGCAMLRSVASKEQPGLPDSNDVKTGVITDHSVDGRACPGHPRCAW